MADIKINDLAAYTDPVSTDVLPIVDVGNDLTKKVSIADLLENAGTGSAAAPSFSFDGDNNTGIYRPAADQVALTAGGTQALLAESTGITIPGNLTVSGTTTTVDTVNLTVKDKNIELGVVSSPSNTTADGGGITLKGATDKTINWVNSTGAWTLSEHINIANAKEYRIDGTKVLDATSLGSALLTNSTSSTSTTTAATPNSVKTSFDLANAALPKTGGTLTGDLTIPDKIIHSGDTNTFIRFPAADTVSVDTAGSERLRIDSSGRLLVGTSSVVGTAADNSYYALLTVKGTATSPSGQGQIALVRGESSTSITANETIGRIVFADADGGNYGLIDCAADGAAGSGDYPGRLVFSTTADGAASPTERLRIDSSGDVEIGSGKYLTWVASPGGTHRGRIKCDSGDSIVFENTSGNSERMRIDSSGRLLVGTSSDRNTFSLQVEGTTASNSGGSFTRNQAGSAGPSLALAKSRGSSLGSKTVVQDDDSLGTIQFNGADGTNDVSGAYIQAFVDGTPGTNDMPGRLVFSTTADGASSPTERLRIDSSGKVGIGTSSPSAMLDIRRADSSGRVARFHNSTGYGVDIGSSTSTAFISSGYNQSLTFKTDPSTGQTERMRIDSSGRLLVGTTTQSGTANQVSIHGSGKNTLSIIDTTSYAAGVGGAINLGGNYRSAGDAQPFVRISAVKENATAGNYAYGMQFETTANGGSSFGVSAMRIDSSGNVGIGTTSQIGTGFDFKISAAFDNNSMGGIALKSTASGSSTMLEFINNSGTEQGKITCSGSSTAYNTSSDYRLKENVVPLTGAADRLNQLQVHRFNFIADPDTTVDGFLAHEAQAVVPECVSGTKDEVDDEGNPVYQGIDQSKLVPLLTAALQELVAEVESLKAEVAALKAQ